jgi:hypothetical protein
MAKRKNQPNQAVAAAVAYFEPQPYENGRFRAVKVPDHELPATTDAEIRGGHQPWSPDRDDTVLQGHPEVAGVYCENYDNRSRFLDSAPTRHDLNYVGPQQIRRRSKGGGW